MSKFATTTNIEIVDSEHQPLVRIDSATGNWDKYYLSNDCLTKIHISS